MNLTFTPQVAEINCQEWNPADGEKVFVQEPTAGEYALFEHLTSKLHWHSTTDEDRREVYAKLGVLFLKKENGQRVFTDDQLPSLLRASSKPLRRLAVKMAELAKLDEDEAEELEKN
jgi:hypothetical protein